MKIFRSAVTIQPKKQRQLQQLQQSPQQLNQGGRETKVANLLRLLQQNCDQVASLIDAQISQVIHLIHTRRSNITIQ